MTCAYHIFVLNAEVADEIIKNWNDTSILIHR